jgi:hypothetical protein
MSVESTNPETAAPVQTVPERKIARADQAALPGGNGPSPRLARIPATGNGRGKRSFGWTDRIVIPSWLASLALHLLFMLTLALTVSRPPGFGKGAGPITISAILGDGPAAGLPGAGSGQPRGPGMGIFLGPGPGASNDQAGDGADDGDDDAANEATAAGGKTAGAQVENDEPPVELALPAAPKASRYAPGPGSFSAAFNDAREIVRGAGSNAAKGRGRSRSGGGDDGPAGGGGKGGSGGGQGGTGHGGGTSFFGHQADGSRFVYVLDASGSMFDYNAISVAKAELLASLEQLDSNQQFAIIFYNDKVHPLRTPEGKEGLLWGTDTNRTFASQFIRSIHPDGGTRHLDALLMALGYVPEVIFFLTDAGEPVLYPADLDKIKKRNNGRSRIFTIEFGKGANLRADNFLKKLARENGGSHAYRDVQEFQKR